MDTWIMVTGGAGYIGMHVTLELLRHKYKVVVVDNFSTTDESNYERVSDVYYPNVQLRRGDICDDKFMDIVFEDYEVSCVIHFAGYKSVGESVRQPLKYYRNNIVSTLTLLECMKEHKVHNIIFSSSASVYGTPESLPILETHACKPESPYGKSKYFIEEILKDVCVSEPKFTCVILRYFNPIGTDPSDILQENPKGIPENLMPYIVGVYRGKFSHLNVFGDDYDTKDGTGVRDYIHITDLALGHLSALHVFDETKDDNYHVYNYHVYNLGTGKGYSVLEVVQAVEKVGGKKIPLNLAAKRPGDVPVCYASATKAHKELRWKAKYDIETMCKHAL